MERSPTAASGGVKWSSLPRRMRGVSVWPADVTAWRDPVCGRMPLSGRKQLMFYVYILKGLSSGRYYIGSAVDIDVRLTQHNRGTVRSTKPYRPWRLIFKRVFLIGLKRIVGKEKLNPIRGEYNLKYSWARILPRAERSHSGLVHRLGKAAYRKVSRVQIPPSPLWVG